MRLVFKELYLFSPGEKTARRVEFSDDINIITSNQTDGTDRGKSVVMRSLYHSMGAEAHFEKKWSPKDKVYILKIAIADQEFYIYRSAGLFKFFNCNKELLFKSTSSHELSEKLKQYTNFAVQLPNRSDKLEITPPAYNYLPYYLDQDHYAGNTYESFKNLGQYTNFKENVLFYHLGAYDECYFEFVHQRDDLREKQKEKEKRQDVLIAMLADLDEKLMGVSFSSSYEELQKDIKQYQNEYATVLNKLNNSKKKLIDLRNNIYEAELILKEMSAVSTAEEKKITSLKKHKCPECGSIITDTISMRSKKYNLLDDMVAIKNDMQIAILDYQKKIQKEELIYEKLLKEMQEYNDKLKLNTKKSSDVLRQKGMAELREDVSSEKSTLDEEVSKFKEDIKELSAKIKAYAEKKKDIEASYYAYMVSARDRFGLNELDPDSFKKLTNTVNASGSNRNIATVIWYLTILKLRKKFNPDAIEFPVVFDSINNVETDDEKKHDLVQYVVDQCNEGQLILSLLGYKKDSIESNRDVNIIELTNEKYKLLDETDYKQYIQLLEALCDA